MIDTKELRRLAQAATPGPDGVSLSWITLLQDFQKGANPAAITELLDRLEAAETEVESLRQEIAFRDDIVATLAVLAQKYEAEIEAMKRQEPVAWIVAPSSRPFWGEYARQDAEVEAQRCGGTAKAEPLYAHPGAKGEWK